MGYRQVNKSHLSREALLERFGELELALLTVTGDGSMAFYAKDEEGKAFMAWMKAVDVRRMLTNKGDLNAEATKVSELVDYVWFVHYDYKRIYENPRVKKRAETFERFSQSKDGKIQI